MKKGNLITLIVLLVFGAMLLYSTLASQRHECTVEIDFRGRTNAATASAASELEAVRQAVTTACGPITAGMDETIACSNTKPVKQECRAL
jgi:energy-converting hydrogenase Eha subunit H